MRKDFIENIFTIWHSQNPHPKTELIYINHYTLLVAVVLSAQSTDAQVNKATKKLFEVVDSPKKMVELGEENLKKYINSIGLFNAKAKNVIKLSQVLLEKYNSKVPQTLEELQSLPGVGRKTANVVLNCAFGKHTIAVDTHVFRIANRIGFVKAKTVEETEEKLMKVVPKKWQEHAHHWMILHGRYVCVARKPKCNECGIKDFCEFKAKVL